MNKVFLIGNITRDPELAETQNGTAVCRFSLAVARGCGEDKETDFFNCTAWRGNAENVARYCRKGSKVAVHGSIQLRKYEDKNGVEKLAVDIVAQEVEFCNRVTEKEENKAESRNAKTSNGKAKTALEAYIDDDDMPF